MPTPSPFHNNQPRSDDVLVRVDNVSKKFCKSLKRSLWYGLCDTARELNPFDKINNQPTTNNYELRTTNQELPRLRADEFWAVRNISFELKRGECLGLIGHNGAGKSTLLKMLNGLIKPDTGRIEMRGRIGALIELGAGFNPILTGRENIYNKGAIIGFTRKEVERRYAEILEFAEITDFIDMPVQNYSSGMKVRLGFAVSAMMDPDVLIIDEVLAVGDLGFVIKCLNRMAEVIPRSAVIFVSHAMPMVNRICTHAMLMDRGAEEYFGDNLAHAIELYIHRFPSAGKANQGTGEVEVDRVGLRSTDSAEYTYGDNYIHQNGEPLQVRIHYRIVPNSIHGFKASLILLDQQLREVLACSPDDVDLLFKVDRNQEEVVVDACLPAIFPNSGIHTLTILAKDDQSNRLFCRTTNAVSFVVRAYTMGWAPNVMRCPWQLADV